MCEYAIGLVYEKLSYFWTRYFLESCTNSHLRHFKKSIMSLGECNPVCLAQFRMFLSPTELKQLLHDTPTGYKAPDDDFFATVNKTLLPEYKKLGVITDIADETPKNDSIDCNIPGCKETFESVAAYQTHYNTSHRYLCATCKRALPTSHLLDLHISENHDTFFQARVERGEDMFACYLEECKLKLSKPSDRRKHMIDVHKFPSNFRFDKFGAVNKHKSRHRFKMDVDKKSSVTTAATDTKVKSFSFGHSTERSFNKQCTKKAVGETLENMSDLMDALEEE